MPSEKTKSRLLFVVLLGLIAFMVWGLVQSRMAGGPVLTEPVAGITKPTVFYFYTEGCPACRQMQPTLEAVTAACSGAPVEFRRINPVDEDSRALSKSFKVKAVPTTSFVDAQGIERNRHVGAFSKSRFLADVAEIAGVSCAGTM